MSLAEAWRVIEDPRSTPNQLLLAEAMIHRHAENGDAAREKQRILAERTDEVGVQARKHLAMRREERR